MKGILINPYERRISEVSFDGTYDGMRRLVFFARSPGYLEAYRIGADHHVMIDEEGMLCDWDAQAFFRLGVEPNAVTFAGNGLILHGTEDGDSDSCLIPIDVIRSTCCWLPPKNVRVPAPTITTLGPDGDTKTELLDGVAEWTHESQPKRKLWGIADRPPADVGKEGES